MQIKATDSLKNSLTLGKIYQVLKEEDLQYIIVDDTGHQVGFIKSHFETIITKQQNLIDEFLDKISVNESEFSEEYCLIMSKEYAIKFQELIIKTFELGKTNPLKSGEEFYNENYQ